MHISERFAVVDRIPSPGTAKLMHSLLGITVTCQPFAPNYGKHAVHLD